MPQKQRIEELEKSQPRFRRIYAEYELFTEELHELENSDRSGIPDDFVTAIQQQASWLEDEIEDWLRPEDE